MASQSNTSNSPIVTALFRDRQSAECAYQAISGRGYSKDDVNVIMSDETRQSQYADGAAGGDTELGNKAMEGTATGAGIGGTVGAVLGAIAAIGTSIALPGLGLLIAGPLAGALVGAGAGGLTGGLIGALVGSGIPEEHAAEYETGIKSGGTVLGVNPRNAEDAAYFEREFTNCGGKNVYSSGKNTSRTTSGTTDASTSTAHNVASTTARTENADRSANTSGNVIPIIEEELQVGKREVETGGVRVESRIEERPVEEHVTLREEHVQVDRHPVNRDVTNADLANFKEGEIDITTHAEEAVVAKQARVVEEVEIGKTVSEREETVRDTVRRTDVDVEETGTDTTRNSDFNSRKANS
ncbi:MAG TPA: YsnF/AvaK domain-containing protein [Pyrinomonadaceae bacterium]|nr:YsnF/AvaK domain-containing protein [Pyrinomonadaceae bacterium]